MVRAEFVYNSSFIIPSAFVNGCVFWGSCIKTGITVGTTAEYLVNAYEGVYNIYQCDLVNGVTFETIDYDDTTIAATGMIILQKHNGKIAKVIHLIVFGDLAGGGTIGDGIIHVDDALAALRHYAGTGIITYEAFFLAADIDHDGYVTDTDATAILSAVGSPSSINQNYSITTVPDGLYYQIPVAFV